MMPLLARPPGAIVLRDRSGPVDVATFEHRVGRLANRLPTGAHALNLCDERHQFLTAFCAAIAAGSTNLLPPNRQRETISDLCRRYDDTIILHDGHLNDSELPCAAIDVREPAAANDGRRRSSEQPRAARDALAAISFTSGSTGRPGANLKRWGALLDGAAINARAMLGDRDGNATGLSLLATVPPQHMYGLELSVMLPLCSDVVSSTGQPLYPADVVAALEALPGPRALVTTPAHLRALLASGLTLPRVERVFSATAPLSIELAQAAERAFDGELVEIYGCSEVGSIARRRTARTDLWDLFDGLSLQAVARASDGTPSWRVGAPHLDAAPELQDALERVGDRQFRLLGRSGDLLNIAGKRGSLADINRRLLEVPGVIDAVAFQPADGRLVAIVVAPTLARGDVLDALRAHLDPVFLPRPILFTDRLPRQASSKLLRHDLLALHARLSGERSRA